jgi:hypothetical protein
MLSVLTLASAAGALAVDVTGKWLSEFESPVGHLKYTYDLKADGEKLTGKATRDVDGEKTEIELREGKFTNDDVFFVEPLPFNDQELRVEYTGKLSRDEIKFTRRVGELATMEIVAKREPTASATNKIALKVVKVDSEETVGEDAKGSNAVDGDPNTFWHSQWQDDNPEPPHEIIIELTPPSTIKGFTYLPRQDEADGAPQLNGTIGDYEFYVSDDGKDFGKPIAKGTFEGNQEKKTVTFEPKQCRYIKLKALTEINYQPWTSAAEITVIPE